jgi:hypothetical protein
MLLRTVHIDTSRSWAARRHHVHDDSYLDNGYINRAEQPEDQGEKFTWSTNKKLNCLESKSEIPIIVIVPTW